MNEPKFKAWDSTIERMFYTEGATISEIVKASSECCDDFWFDPNKDIWLQSSNEPDIGDNIIYQDDIIFLSTVEWCDGSKIEPGKYRVEFTGSCFTVDGMPLYVVNRNCKIIGNIHENSELLT